MGSAPLEPEFREAHIRHLTGLSVAEMEEMGNVKLEHTIAYHAGREKAEAQLAKEAADRIAREGTRGSRNPFRRRRGR